MGESAWQDNGVDALEVVITVPENGALGTEMFDRLDHIEFAVRTGK